MSAGGRRARLICINKARPRPYHTRQHERGHEALGLLTTVPRLLASEPVTTIALDLDYSSPAAFTAMFRKLVGASPTAYRRAAH